MQFADVQRRLNICIPRTCEVPFTYEEAIYVLSVFAYCIHLSNLEDAPFHMGCIIGKRGVYFLWQNS